MDKTLEEEIKKSFPRIEKLFDKQGKLEFMNTPEEKLSLYHFGLGNFVCHATKAIIMSFISN